MEEILYDGAGNLFRMMDGRGGPRPSAYAGQPARDACSLSDGRRTDGLIVLSDAEAEHCAFSMYYFNNDGSGGVMCGNGGRCAVAFAHDLGIPHAPEGVWFTAAGKRYHGTLLRDAGDDKTVRLKMADVTVARALPEPAGWYLDTGCPHFVQWMGEAPGFGEFPIEQAALPLRHHPAFSPDGVNVDFVALGPGYYRIRTYERGVEAETLSCGTGIVASAIALALREGRSGPQRLDFRAVGGSLSVDLTVHPERTGPAPVATGIFLTGPTHRH